MGFNEELLPGNEDGSGTKAETASVATLSDAVFQGPHKDQVSSRTIPNKRSTPEHRLLDSLRAFATSLRRGGRLPVTTSDGAGKQGVHTETIIGTPEQQPSRDLGSYMPTAQPSSLATNSALPSSDTSAGPPLLAKTLYREVSRHYPTICSNTSHH